MSGSQRVIQVIDASTSDAFFVLHYDEASAGLVESITSLSISSSTTVAYSLTVPTSDVREEYDPELVAALLRADAEKPEATFTNVIDMMEWLERD